MLGRQARSGGEELGSCEGAAEKATLTANDDGNDDTSQPCFAARVCLQLGQLSPAMTSVAAASPAVEIPVPAGDALWRALEADEMDDDDADERLLELSESLRRLPGLETALS